MAWIPGGKETRFVVIIIMGSVLDLWKMAWTPEQDREVFSTGHGWGVWTLTWLERCFNIEVSFVVSVFYKKVWLERCSQYRGRFRPGGVMM